MHAILTRKGNNSYLMTVVRVSFSQTRASLGLVLDRIDVFRVSLGLVLCLVRVKVIFHEF